MSPPHTLYLAPGGLAFISAVPRYDPSHVDDPAKILLIRPSALGDVCRSVPVLTSLKRAWPDAEVDWLVQDDFTDAIRAHPDLRRAVPFPRRQLSRALRRLDLDSPQAWLDTLRQEQYDLVIDAQGLFRSGFISWASGARRRVGHRAARELAWLFYTRRERGSEHLHTVDRMLGLIETLGIEPARDMRLFAPPEDRRAVVNDPTLAGRCVVLAPTSRWPGKQWPAERFDALAEQLLAADAADRVLVVGGPGERDQCAPLLARAELDDRVVDLVGSTSIGRLMAIIERAALVVANDSAALHMAVGFDRPLVALFGPTHTQLVGPYRRDADVLQHLTPGDHTDHKDEPSGRALMQRIALDEVVDAALARLA